MAKKSTALLEYDEAGNVTAKTCSKCGKMTSLTEFAKDRRREGGVESSCKVCKSIRDADYKKKKRQAGGQAESHATNTVWAEEIYISGKRKFGAMLRGLFPSQVVFEDIKIAGHTIAFFVPFANIVINYDPVSGDNKRMDAVRAEVMRVIVEGETFSDGIDFYEIEEPNPNFADRDTTTLIEVIPGKEIDAIRRVVIAIEEHTGDGVSWYMKNRVLDLERIDIERININQGGE
ncbi:hypothetical protein [Desulfosporosinus fructosivorans]